MICSHFLDRFLNQPELIFLYAVKWFQVFLSVVIKRKITEWEITKTEVWKEMETFITLNKYNTRQQTWRKVSTASGDDLAKSLPLFSQ